VARPAVCSRVGRRRRARRREDPRVLARWHVEGGVRGGRPGAAERARPRVARQRRAEVESDLQAGRDGRRVRVLARQRQAGRRLPLSQGRAGRSVAAGSRRRHARVALHLPGRIARGRAHRLRRRRTAGRGRAVPRRQARRPAQVVPGRRALERAGVPRRPAGRTVRLAAPLRRAARRGARHARGTHRGAGVAAHGSARARVRQPGAPARGRPRARLRALARLPLPRATAVARMHARRGRLCTRGRSGGVERGARPRGLRADQSGLGGNPLRTCPRRAAALQSFPRLGHRRLDRCMDQSGRPRAVPEVDRAPAVPGTSHGEDRTRPARGLQCLVDGRLERPRLDGRSLLFPVQRLDAGRMVLGGHRVEPAPQPEPLAHAGRAQGARERARTRRELPAPRRTLPARGSALRSRTTQAAERAAAPDATGGE
jgi:hypothetical protein